MESNSRQAPEPRRYVWILLRMGLSLLLLGIAMVFIFSTQRGGSLRAALIGLYLAAPLFFPMPVTLLAVIALIIAWGFVSIPSRLSARALFGLGLGWWVVYLTYTGFLHLSGHTMLLQGFDFRRIIDLPYLFLMSLYPVVVLRIQLKSYSRYDVYGLMIGFCAMIIMTLLIYCQGPVGPPTGSTPRVVAFVFGLPAWLLLMTSVVSLFINCARWIWWEMTRRTAFESGEAP